MSLVGRARVAWKEEVLVTSRYVKPRQRLKTVKAHEELCRLEQRVSLARLLGTARRAGARPRHSSAFAGERARTPDSGHRVGTRKRQRSAPSSSSTGRGGGGPGVDYVRYVPSPPPPPPPPPQFAGGSRARAGRGGGPGSGFGMESSGKDTSSEDTESVRSLSTLFSMSSLSSMPEAPFVYSYKPPAPGHLGVRPNGVSVQRAMSDRSAAPGSTAAPNKCFVTLTPGAHYKIPFHFRLPAHLPCSLRQASHAGANAVAGTEEDFDSEWECDVVRPDDESEKDGKEEAADEEEVVDDDDDESPLWSASAEYAVRVALDGWPDACAHVTHRSFTVIRNLDLKDELPALTVPAANIFTVATLQKFLLKVLI